MTNLCIKVNDCSIESEVTGKIVIGFTASGTNGGTSVGNVTLDFASSATTTNSQIVTAAKAAFAARFGITFTGSDKVILLGGAS